MIKSARKKESPFTVHEVSNEEILKTGGQNCLKKKTTNSVQDKKIKFMISKCRQLKYTSDNKGYVTVSEFIGGVTSEVFKLLKVNVNDFNFPSDKVYDGSVGINKKKVNDVMKIKHIPEECRELYNSILSWKTKDGEEHDGHIDDCCE